MSLRRSAAEPEIIPPDSSPSPSPTADVGLAEARVAFAEEDRRRADMLEHSPVMLFLDRHEEAGSPNELTITGVADVKLTLGDLRRFVRALK